MDKRNISNKYYLIVTYYHQSRWTFGVQLCNVTTSVDIITASASIYNFVLVNLDRLLVVKFPMEYHNTSDKYIKIGISVCWLLALLPATPVWSSSDWNEKLKEKVEQSYTCTFPYHEVRLGQTSKLSTPHLRSTGSGQPPPSPSSSPP